MGKRIVIALGGNALGKNLPEQMLAVKETSKAIADLVEAGHTVAVAHGNGPQVGMIQNAFAAYCRQEPSADVMPLSMCVAMSQGYIGYDLQNALKEELLNRGLQQGVATVLTQVVVDATNRESILELKRNRAFTKAVSNMAIMDITDIEPLLMAVYELLQESGIFVFATQHPCFVTLTEKYMTPHSYYDIAIEGQPKEQIYYHRSIQDIFNLCFRAGFVIDGFYEECFKTNKEIPMVMIVRLKKVKRDSLK